MFDKQCQNLCNSLVMVGVLALALGRAPLQCVGCGLVTLVEAHADLIPGCHCGLIGKMVQMKAKSILMNEAFCFISSSLLNELIGQRYGVLV